MNFAKIFRPGALLTIFIVILLVLLIAVPGLLISTLNYLLPDADKFRQIYPALMLIALFLWLILMAVFLVYLMRKYDTRRFPENPYKNETLGLPPGTIRAVLTMTLLMLIIVAEIYILVYGRKEEDIQYLHTGFQMMLAFYFGTRVVGALAGGAPSPKPELPAAPVAPTTETTGTEEEHPGLP
jgi:L-asparagine transporter-like permease